MKRTTSTSWIGLLAMIVAAMWQAPADAASHQWRFNEIFSNADGTVQFIEMKECCGFVAETQLSGKWILAVDASNQYDFPQNLNGNTANKYLLLATQSFADLAGAPAPDFILPDNFLALGADTLEYWLYSSAVWSYSGLPTDGSMSLNGDGSTGLNSPTNFTGETGTIDVSVPVSESSWSEIKATGSEPE